MVGLLATAGDVEREELEAAQAAHQLLDGRRRGARLGELPVRGRKRRKDRRELTSHLARVLTRCSEEEFDATTRFADAAGLRCGPWRPSYARHGGRISNCGATAL